MDNPVKKELDNLTEHYGKRLSVEEFLVDFLGGLVPGVLFIVSTAFAVIAPVHAIWAALSPGEPKTLGDFVASFFQSIQNTPSAIWLILFVEGLLFAFVVGHLFYRYDPKKADRSSFRRLAKLKENKLIEDRKRNLGCTDPGDCEFPYPYYHLYLKQRGLDHLLPFILWHKDSNLRSKTYINLLKVRLRYHYPEKCGAIIRNEAHVRLASSTWHVERILICISALSLMITLTAMIRALLIRSIIWPQAIAWHIPALLSPLIVLTFSLFAWHTIRGFLHYQRLREIFFVLETAHTAFLGKYDLLDPPFNKFKYYDWGRNE